MAWPRLARPVSFACMIAAGVAFLGAPLRATTTAPSFIPAPAPLVHLLSPAAGTPLIAGASGEIVWEPAAGLAQVPAAEEWEAFLSLDGGATYPLRLTPHLDQDVRRVGFQVPAIATREARLLLRFGDERRESWFVVPQRFVIAAAAVELPLATPSLFTARPSLAVTGERPLPRAAGVVAWVEGSRRAVGLRQVVGNGRGALGPAFVPPSWRTELAVLVAPAAMHEITAPRGSPAAPPPRPRHRLVAAAAPRSGPEILGLTQRQNE